MTDEERRKILERPLISVRQASLVLGINELTAARAVARGDIPTIQFGNRKLVQTAKLREMIGWAPQA